LTRILAWGQIKNNRQNWFLKVCFKVVGIIAVIPVFKAIYEVLQNYGPVVCGFEK